MTISSTGKPPSKSGFTLIEVLVAFAVLLTGLTLVAAGFSRHLTALAILRDSLIAGRWADRRLTHELLRREQNSLVVEEEPLPAGFRESFIQEPVRLEKDPLKKMKFQSAAAQVSWGFRKKGRSIRRVVGWPEERGER